MVAGGTGSTEGGGTGKDSSNIPVTGSDGDGDGPFCCGGGGAAGRRAGEDFHETLINGVDGWYHASEPHGASGCLASALTTPPFAGDDGPTVAAPPLALANSPIQCARR